METVDIIPTEQLPTDDEIRAQVRAHVTEIVAHTKAIIALLGEHSTDVDYHSHLLKRAIGEINDFTRTVEHLETKTTPSPPYREPVETGPPDWDHGPRRFKVTIRAMRGRWDGLDRWGKETTFEVTDDDVKKIERPRYYDRGYSAKTHARGWTYADWVTSVQILDRETKTLWTSTDEGWAEVMGDPT